MSSYLISSHYGGNLSLQLQTPWDAICRKKDHWGKNYPILGSPSSQSRKKPRNLCDRGTSLSDQGDWRLVSEIMDISSWMWEWLRTRLKLTAVKVFKKNFVKNFSFSTSRNLIFQSHFDFHVYLIVQFSLSDVQPLTQKPLVTLPTLSSLFSKFTVC